MIACAIALPLALLRWKNPDNNFLFGKFYGPLGRRIMGLHVLVEGEEHLSIRPAIFTINHQSGIDLATLARVYPRGAVIIGKKELRWIPFFGLMFEAFGNILIDRKDRKNSLSGLNTAVEALRSQNLSTWIFPEGTRNASGEGLLPFKKGAFYMAIQTQEPIVPIVCSKVSRLVSFKEKYAHSGTVVIRILPPIPTAGMKMGEVDSLLEKTRNLMLDALREVSARAEALDREV